MVTAGSIGFVRHDGGIRSIETDRPSTPSRTSVQHAAEDKWFEFRSKAREFIGLYEAVSPDPAVLEFTDDLKWVAIFLQYGTQVFEKREAFDQQSYSRKIRDMLDQHLDATGAKR